MSEVTEVVESTIDKVLSRVDILAAKLGIAAAEVWKFTVGAKMVEARRDLAKYMALLLLPLIFWGWAVHVATMSIPHDMEEYMDHQSDIRSSPCQQVAVVNGKQQIVQETCFNDVGKVVPIKKDKGISNIGGLLVASGIIFALAGLLAAGIAVQGIIESLADARMAQYNAYQDLLYDWK